MTRHLVDDVAVCWDELGTDLLDGAPPEIVTALVGTERWPSTTPTNLITPDGSAPVRMGVTEKTAADQDIQWGYILRPSGIEVIAVQHAPCGSVVSWSADPRTPFSNHPAHWPVSAPPSAGSRASRSPYTSPAADASTARRAARR
ncbi:hypothetical protein [Streptomyces sp. NPDC058683]|uniref:hypothetical protein n=1 Tax=Streptomyces sp. NPDC058683 TaxID=3346597 RepID=UPI00364F8356